MILDDQISQQKDSGINLQPGTISKENRSVTPKKNKKNLILIHYKFIVQECIYKGTFYNTYKGSFQIELTQKKQLTYFQYLRIRQRWEEECCYQDATCFVSPIWVGEEKISGVNYQVKILKQMGPSLKIVFGLQNHTFLQHTIFLLALNLITSVENLHKHDIVHRNLRPRKIITDFNLKLLNLYFVDFKYARKFRHKSGQTIRYTESNRHQNKQFANKFSSLGVHMGISPCQKDDLESIGYILVYFLKRDFQISQLKNKGKLFVKKKQYLNHEEKINHYEEQKLNFVPENYKDIIPLEVMSYLTYIKMLNQQDKIDYDYIKKLFRGGLQRLNINIHEQRYEWSTRIKQDLIAFNSQMNGENILGKDVYELSSRMPGSERNIETSFQQDVITHQAQIVDIDKESVQARADFSIEINQKIKVNDSYNSLDQVTSARQINQTPSSSHNLNQINSTNNIPNIPNYISSIQNINSNQMNTINSSNNLKEEKPNQIQYEQNGVRVIVGSQINVIGDNEQEYCEVGEKYDYKAFLKMNSTDEKNNGGFARMSSQSLESQFLKDPFQRQVSNLSKKSDRSLFSRFNSKSFEEGISDEITSQHPSLEKQIMKLAGGINPLNLFTLSKRNKYFSGPDNKYKNASQIDEVEEYSEVQVNNNIHNNYYQIEND